MAIEKKEVRPKYCTEVVPVQLFFNLWIFSFNTETKAVLVFFVALQKPNA